MSKTNESARARATTDDDVAAEMAQAHRVCQEPTADKLANLATSCQTPQARARMLAAAIRGALDRYVAEVEASAARTRMLLDNVTAWSEGREDMPDACRALYDAFMVPGSSSGPKDETATTLEYSARGLVCQVLGYLEHEPDFDVLVGVAELRKETGHLVDFIEETAQADVRVHARVLEAMLDAARAVTGAASEVRS